MCLLGMYNGTSSCCKQRYFDSADYFTPTVPQERLSFEKRTFGESCTRAKWKKRKINEQNEALDETTPRNKVPGINFDFFGIDTRKDFNVRVVTQCFTSSVPVKMLTTRWKRTRALCTKRMAASQWCISICFSFVFFFTRHTREPFCSIAFFLSRQSESKKGLINLVALAALSINNYEERRIIHDIHIQRW